MNPENSSKIILETVNGLIGLLRRRVANSKKACRNDISRLNVAKKRLNQLNNDHLSAEQRLKRLRRLRYLPLLSSAYAKTSDNLNLIESKIGSGRKSARSLARRINRNRSLIADDVARAKKLIKVKKAIPYLGAPPIELEGAIEGTTNQINFIKRARGVNRDKHINDLCSQVVSIATTWAAAVKIAQTRRRVTSSPSQVQAQGSPNGFKIYLPIPVSLRAQAQRLGASYDPNGGYGSRVFVRSDEDRERLEHLLPIAFRQRNYQFEFPPIRYNASGQNLWGLFDRNTWDHIRTASYDRAGRRCMICGNRGGKIMEHIMPPDQVNKNRVDCHEVWQWEVPEASNGIGIQKLKELLVVCVSCHMMFHEGFAISRAREYGDAEFVRDHIEKRRCLVNRMTAGDLNILLEEGRSEWERMNGVDQWILDLSHLGNQDFMNRFEAVFNEENEARFRSENVAGLEFSTDRGYLVEKQSVEDIYSRLVGRDIAEKQVSGLFG